jgi:hypothetical protein
VADPKERSPSSRFAAKRTRMPRPDPVGSQRALSIAPLVVDLSQTTLQSTRRSSESSSEGLAEYEKRERAPVAPLADRSAPEVPPLRPDRPHVSAPRRAQLGREPLLASRARRVWRNVARRRGAMLVPRQGHEADAVAIRD